MEQFFKDKRTLARLNQGPLAGYLRVFAMELEAEGYRPEPACKMLKLVDEFGAWLKQKHIPAEAITARQAAEFSRCRARKRRPKFSDNPALKRLLKILEEQRAKTLEPVPPRQGPADRFCDEFSGYLQRIRGLSDRSITTYREIAHKFLTLTHREAGDSLSDLRAPDVTRFVIQQAKVLGPKRAALTVCALRSFLQFARFRNYVTTDLRAAVPKVPGRSLTVVQKALPMDQVIQVLATCNRNSSRGRRDYAIILLLARLGLRASEVVSLRLDDIDWQEASISVRGKGGSVSKLPVPPDVGEALVDYLRSGRPGTSSRALFFSVKAPVTALNIPTAIGHIVERALSRARIDCPRKGAHLFRHALATEMLRQGASLPEIGEILRHHSPQSTMIYTSVDLLSLRKLAAPWPGGE
jgi:integrase/recombinase XerD